MRIEPTENGIPTRRIMNLSPNLALCQGLYRAQGMCFAFATTGIVVQGKDWAGNMSMYLRGSWVIRA